MEAVSYTHLAVFKWQTIEYSAFYHAYRPFYIYTLDDDLVSLNLSVLFTLSTRSLQNCTIWCIIRYRPFALRYSVPCSQFFLSLVLICKITCFVSRYGPYSILTYSPFILKEYCYRQHHSCISICCLFCSCSHRFVFWYISKRIENILCIVNPR